jgi:flagellar L-ring protein precursor FlgH
MAKPSAFHLWFVCLAGALRSLAAVSASAGSLADSMYNAPLAERMYSTQRAFRIGDLVTVIVNESTSSSKREALQAGKEANATAAAGEIGDFSPDPETDGKRYTDYNQALRFKTPPYKIAASADFNGDGKATSEESLNTRFASQIADVLPNGVFVLRGERIVSMAGERMTMVLTGLARAQDISADNTIDSTRLANARIHYKTEGNVSRMSKPGWLWKVFQVVNPF